MEIFYLSKQILFDVKNDFVGMEQQTGVARLSWVSVQYRKEDTPNTMKEKITSYCANKISISRYGMIITKASLNFEIMMSKNVSIAIWKY